MSSSRPSSASPPPSDHKNPLSSIIKLRKIPPIPTRQIPRDEVSNSGNGDSGSDDSDTIDPAKLGLNQITRSEPLAHAHSIGTIQPKFETKGEKDADLRPKASSAFQQHASTSVEGKRVHWSKQYLSLKVMIREKYVLLCRQIDDEKGDLLNTAADEDSSTEEDAMRSLRASPINLCTKDRTSIEDFEIIKPISRDAFGRVFFG